MVLSKRVLAGFLLLHGFLGGCGAGGFQGSDNPPTGPSPNAHSYKVFGVASKGVIRGGTVSFFALNSNGTQGALLKTAGTDAFGNYSASINQAGPTLVTASGVYTDESTGTQATILPDAPLRAAVDAITDSMNIAITPLTELAVRKTAPLLVSGNISTANKLISDIFKVDDIIATQPLALTSDQFSKGTQAQKDYTLVLAAISQMAHDHYGGSMGGTVAAMYNDLARGDALGEGTLSQYQASLSTFLQSDLNQTGIRDIKATNLIYSGGSTKVIKLATGGTLPPGWSITGVTVTIALPSDMSVRIGNFIESTTDPACVKGSGNFLGASTNGHFLPATDTQPATLKVSVVSATNTGLGEFLTIVCDVPAGATYSAADFSLSDVEVVGGSDFIQVPGVTVEIL